MSRGVLGLPNGMRAPVVVDSPGDRGDDSAGEVTARACDIVKPCSPASVVNTGTALLVGMHNQRLIGPDKGQPQYLSTTIP